MSEMVSTRKVIRTYFSAITAEPLFYESEVFQPLPIKISSSLFDGFSCFLGCGGCCQAHTLDYLPYPLENPIPQSKPIEYEINGKRFTIWSDDQKWNTKPIPEKGFKHSVPRCYNLGTKGECLIHGNHPFTCDFELIRFRKWSSPEGPFWLIREGRFPRVQLMRTLDGGMGGLCTIDPPTPETARDVIRRLRRLQTWADYFELNHRLPQILEYCDRWKDTPAEAPPYTIGV